MTKSKIHQKSRAPKARAEKPVSNEIFRAAARAGVLPLLPRNKAQLLAAQLRDLSGSLVEVMEHLIASRVEEFALENFEDALTKVRGVRICLAHEADRLDPQQAVTS